MNNNEKIIHTQKDQECVFCGLSFPHQHEANSSPKEFTRIYVSEVNTGSMTNNNWIETNLYKILHELELCLDADVDNTQIVCSREEIAKIFCDSLTKKDQEHKAELEMIKGEIRNEQIAAFNGMKISIKGDIESRNQGLQDAITIIDSNINKQNL